MRVRSVAERVSRASRQGKARAGLEAVERRGERVEKDRAVVAWPGELRLARRQAGCRVLGVCDDMLLGNWRSPVRAVL